MTNEREDLSKDHVNIHLHSTVIKEKRLILKDQAFLFYDEPFVIRHLTFVI